MVTLTMSHRRRKSILPKNIYDSLAVMFLFTCVVVGFIYNIYTLIPFSDPHFVTYCCKIALLLYLAVNAIGNFIYLILVDTSILTVFENLSKNQEPGWRVCAVCEANAPPRSYHCHVCNICILKREHHCVFSACCIGFYNYRYYMGFLTHLWLGAVYSAFLNFCTGYLWQFFEITDIYTLMYHIFPVLFWVFGKLETKMFGILVMSVMILHGTIFLTTLMFYHWNLILNGQTTNEKTYKVFKYKSPYWKDNVKKVFGSNWVKTLIWFNAPSALRGNGVSFGSREL